MGERWEGGAVDRFFCQAGPSRTMPVNAYKGDLFDPLANARAAAAVLRARGRWRPWCTPLWDRPPGEALQRTARYD